MAVYFGLVRRLGESGHGPLSSNSRKVRFVTASDGSIVEAASWRLASELFRRHPHTLRLIRAHPGGGTYDCLWLRPVQSNAPGSIFLNRVGTIQIHDRFDGRGQSGWNMVTWEQYYETHPRDFLLRFEDSAGLAAPSVTPVSTPASLTYRVMACLVATSIKTLEPITIEQGYIDTSGYGGGPNASLDLFEQIPVDLRTKKSDDFLDEPGFRFWIVLRGVEPILVFEQESGFVWTRHNQAAFSVMELYQESRRNLIVTALKLFRRVDQV